MPSRTNYARVLAALSMTAIAAVARGASQPATRPATAPADATVIEVDVPRKFEQVGLGTGAYRPTKRESTFLAKTPEKERVNGSMVDDTPYELSARNGQRVAWFGIVRRVSKTGPEEYELVVEHKYFDGLTDLHILALSFNGAGDFVIRLNAAGDLPVRPLMLIRAYGVIQVPDGKRQAGAATVPTMHPDYVRAYPWRTFTFLSDYGKDRSNPTWRKACKVPLDKLYDPYPEEAYYEARLGARPK